MDDKRKGEIALKLVEYRFLSTPMPTPNNFNRELGNIAKDAGVDLNELRDFYADILPKLVGKMFNKNSVSITMSDR
ncbi:MAG TPA: hypothetical protein VHD31_02915 [Candidatus Paceibacterota bacterium]|nr:hypothetical protein [Candidatus Paceibacterota bacterium]